MEFRLQVISLSQEILHHFAFHICQAEAPGLEFIRQSFMIYAHKIQKGSLKIMHVYRIFYTSPGHPHGKAAGMMIRLL